MIHLPRNLPICVRWGGDFDSPSLWPVDLTQVEERKRRADVSTTAVTSLRSSKEPDLHANGWDLVVVCDYDDVAPRALEPVPTGCGIFATAEGCMRRALASTVSFCLRRGRRRTTWWREMFIERLGRAGVERLFGYGLKGRGCKGPRLCFYISPFQQGRHDGATGWIQPL